MPHPKAHAQANEPDRRPRRAPRHDGRPMRRSGPVRNRRPFPDDPGATRQPGTTGDSADPHEDPNARSHAAADDREAADNLPRARYGRAARDEDGE